MNSAIKSLYYDLKSKQELEQYLSDCISDFLDRAKTIERPRINVMECTGCWHFIGGFLRGNYPYFNFDIPGYEALAVAKVLKVLYSKDLNFDADEEFSHRCGRKECVKPGHIILESRSDNMKRKKCHKRKVCECGLDHPCIFGTRNSRN